MFKYIRRVSECTRKSYHYTEESAIKEKDRLKTFTDPKTIDALEVYKCRYCNGWHIGHNAKVVNRMRQKNIINEKIKKLKNKLTKDERKTLGKFIGYIMYKKYGEIHEA